MDWAVFHSLRKAIDRQISSAHLLYINDVIGDSLESQNIKPFWRYVKAKGQHTFLITLHPVQQALWQSWRTKSEFSASNSSLSIRLKTSHSQPWYAIYLWHANTSTAQAFINISTSKDSYKYSFFCKIIADWNLLPPHVHSAGFVDLLLQDHKPPVLD